ncbi:MAG TPA: methyltransferase [Candidatus Polarisedimenticolia bacterium]|jgi:phospholipid N-methyltransferase
MARTSSSTKLFLEGARRQFSQTGAIAPSSRFLARAITWAIDPRGEPKTVMEAGAGTGALTVEIIRRLPAGSRLDIYEVNPVFAQHLERTFCGNGGGVAVTVNNLRVQELPDGSRYDLIISGLPFNNFEPPVVKEILSRLMEALEPAGVLSYFEYLLIRQMKSLAVMGDERRRLRRVARVASRFLDKHEFRRDTVLLNIPPAVVHHLRRAGRVPPRAGTGRPGRSAGPRRSR